MTEQPDIKEWLRDMKICPNCSAQNRDTARFCVECGTRLADAPPQPGAPASARHAVSPPPSVRSQPVKPPASSSSPGRYSAVPPSRSGGPPPAPKRRRSKPPKGKRGRSQRPPAAKAASDLSSSIAEATARAAAEADRLRASELEAAAVPPPPAVPAKDPAPVPLAAQPQPAPPTAADERDDDKHSAPPPSLPPEAGADFNQMLQDIEDGFSAILDPQASSEFGATSSQLDFDKDQVRKLFDEIASHYVRPVRQLMIELRFGDPPKEWLDIATPAITSLKRSAQGMGLDELAQAAERFKDTLEEAGRVSDGTTLAEPARKVLNAGYEDLASTMPEAFRLDEDASRREPIIIQSLLRQIPGVGKVTIDKIYHAGLHSLEMFAVARAQDLADATSVPHDLAERIVQRFADYQREAKAVVPDGDDTLPRSRLGELVDEFARHHNAYQETEGAWGRDAGERRRRHRREREEAWLAIQVMLARVGEVDWLNQLETFSYGRRLAALVEALESKTP